MKDLKQLSTDVLYLVLCEFIERQRKELNLDESTDIFITAEKNGDGIDIHTESRLHYPPFIKTIKTKNIKK